MTCHVIFMRLRPPENGNHMKFTKRGVSHERVGVAQNFFQILISFDEYYRFDLSADIYGVAPL